MLRMRLDIRDTTNIASNIYLSNQPHLHAVVNIACRGGEPGLSSKPIRIVTISSTFWGRLVVFSCAAFPYAGVPQASVQLSIVF